MTRTSFQSYTKRLGRFGFGVSCIVAGTYLFGLGMSRMLP
jgi:hypothetical protein